MPATNDLGERKLDAALSPLVVTVLQPPRGAAADWLDEQVALLEQLGRPTLASCPVEGVHWLLLTSAEYEAVLCERISRLTLPHGLVSVGLLDTTVADLGRAGELLVVVLKPNEALLPEALPAALSAAEPLPPGGTITMRRGYSLDRSRRALVPRVASGRDDAIVAVRLRSDDSHSLAPASHTTSARAASDRKLNSALWVRSEPTVDASPGEALPEHKAARVMSSFALAPRTLTAAGGTRLALSVIMCVHNGARTMDAQLERLAAEEWDQPWEVVIVDNRSKDDTAVIANSYVARLPERFRLATAPEHANLSYARNVGVGYASGNALAFVDDDDEIEPGWVAAIGRALASNAVVVSALHYERLNAPALLRGRARFQSTHVETLFGQPVTAGAGMGCQRWVYERVGGNDESLYRTGEDFAFALDAALLLGVTPHFAADAKYNYRLRDGWKANFRQARRYGASHVTLYQRYRSKGPLAAALAHDRSKDRRGVWREWHWVLTRAPLALLGRNRDLWARKAGRRIGRIEGCLRERIWLP